MNKKGAMSIAKTVFPQITDIAEKIALMIYEVKYNEELNCSFLIYFNCCIWSTKQNRAILSISN